MRNPAVFALIVSQIVEPLFHERANIVIVRRRAAKRIDVARPPQPFVALRAVGGNIHKVSALTPNNVLHKPVEAFIARMYAPRAAHIGVHDKRGNSAPDIRTYLNP